MLPLGSISDSKDARAQGQQKGKKPVQPELSEVTAISGRKHRGFAREGEGTCWQMSSFGETKGMKLIDRMPAEWAVHNTQQFSRTYPKARSAIARLP